MSLEIFARQSLAQFAIIYGEIFTEGKGKAINPSEIETLMWGRMCAKEAGIVKTGFKIPYDNIKRAKVTLPYMPDDINYTGCCAIKKNGGLYTPCCGKVAEDTFYCKACSVDKEGDAKELEFGTTDDRDQNVEDGRFAPITFAEWMKAHKNMSLPEVYSKLREAGIALEIPANELMCRELPKRRKGRPAKSDDSVVDEDTVPKKGKKAKASDSDDEKPKKKAKAVKAESDSESEVEAPKPKAKKVKADEAPKPKAKAKKAEASEDEAPKAKKSPKASPAPSEDEAPKAKAKKVKSPEASEDEAPKAKKSPKASPAPSEDEAAKPKAKVKSPEVSEDEAPKKAPKAKKPKADEAPKVEPKAKKPKADAPKKAEKPKKASSGSESDTPKKKKAPEPEPEPVTLEAEDAEDEDEEDQEIEINGVDYTLRNGKFVIAKDDGRIVATVNDEGEPEWVDGEEP